MAGLITRGSKVDSMLPDITVKNPHLTVENLSKSNDDDTQTENLLGEDNYNKLKKYDRGESDSDVDMQERAPGALNDPDDKFDEKIKEAEENSKNKQKITMKMINQKETRPQKEPELETMKRANNRKPKGSRIMDDEDKHQKRVEKVQKKLLQAHA